jgi:hypothetical protein
MVVVGAFVLVKDRLDSVVVNSETGGAASATSVVGAGGVPDGFEAEPSTSGGFATAADTPPQTPSTDQHKTIAPRHMPPAMLPLYPRWLITTVRLTSADCNPFPSNSPDRRRLSHDNSPLHEHGSFGAVGLPFMWMSRRSPIGQRFGTPHLTRQPTI